MANMKIKAKLKGEVTEVTVKAKHEMSTYNQAEKRTGDRNNAKFITHISASANNKVVFDCSTSQFWSKDPQFKFSFKGAKAGDEVAITWTDNKGETVTESKKIK
ncbi:MAG: thiosulfate oxidation carrier complex protein SoxZ [Pseudomonadota bacterium]|jgi:sulfur-oxidizing protein SoxZ